jgi:hypothetical protein
MSNTTSRRGLSAGRRTKAAAAAGGTAWQNGSAARVAAT